MICDLVRRGSNAFVVAEAAMWMSVFSFSVCDPNKHAYITLLSLFNAYAKKNCVPGLAMTD